MKISTQFDEWEVVVLFACVSLDLLQECVWQRPILFLVF